MERPAMTGKDQLYVLKSEPTIATPRIAPNRIAAGAKAIELKTDGWVNAQTTTLLSLRGKIVVLDFWAIWCGPCVRELPHVEALAKRFAGKPVVVIGIHDGTAVPQELVQFAKKKGLSYALAIDRKATTGFGVTANAYGIQGIPTMVVIDRNGKVFDLPAGADEAANVVAKLLQQ